jgi:glutamyl-Q tRNA(Asp) synthetase
MLTRFAPSPTGYLHLGHVVNAIYVWGLAHVLGGRVLLRMEDHDRIRCRAEYDAALIADLAWLGFGGSTEQDPPDDRSSNDRSPGPALWTRQSDHPHVYEEALARLRTTAQVYACDCSRKDIGGERYGGHCRTRGLAEGAGRGLRVALGPGVERFDDLELGPQEQVPADQCGDLLVRDRDGHWTYHFAVTVDDWREGITHVIRGIDLLTSTGRQLRLARLLGRPQPPAYLHHPLLIKPSGAKLSKSSRDTGVRELRLGGLTAAEVIGRAATHIGLTASPRPIAAAEVGTLFQGAALRRAY